MRIVTGGAGFIGANIVKALNDRGETDILVVDELTQGERFRNLADCVIADYMDRDEFLDAVLADSLPDAVEAVFHQGACADTMERDGRYMMRNNYTFSKHLLRWALGRGVPFVYASSGAVYGNSRVCAETPENEQPLNVYGYSKLAFDQHVRRILPRAESTVVGFRYMNVYGPREGHKGRMASMVHQIYRRLAETGTARLFGASHGYAAGEQRRDFVSVSDVVKVNLHFADGPPRRGVFNVGTGSAVSFNEVAETIMSLLGKGSIRYIPFPEGLVEKYQPFTEADLTGLRAAGYDADFTPLTEGVAAAVEAWKTEDLFS